MDSTTFTTCTTPVISHLIGLNNHVLQYLMGIGGQQTCHAAKYHTHRTYKKIFFSIPVFSMRQTLQFVPYQPEQCDILNNPEMSDRVPCPSVQLGS